MTRTIRDCGPIGVALACGTEEKFWKILPPRSFFFPLHEKAADKIKEVPSIESFFNDKATRVYIWRTPPQYDVAGKVGGQLVTAPAGWLDVILYEDAGGGARKCTLKKLPDKYINNSFGWTEWRVDLDGLPRDGYVIGNGLGAPLLATAARSIEPVAPAMVLLVGITGYLGLSRLADVYSEDPTAACAAYRAHNAVIEGVQGPPEK